MIEASASEPYLGVEMRLDASIVASLLPEVPEPGMRNAPAIAVAQAAEDIMEPLDRLLRLLTRPADIPVLAHQYERELYYRLLQGPMGGTLRQIVQHTAHFRQVRAAAEWICSNADKPLHVGDLAKGAGMSVASFHRHFKALTAHSPLAYQRHIRLLEARRLLALGATNVTSAAFTTGYASSSQFSREYK